MNDNDLRNTSHDDYKRLMAEAYPAPKKDIHAAVMAQIAAEAEQSNKKANILTRARMNRFVKFGSMAACFVLLVTLGFRVAPMMKNAAAESMTDAAAPETAMVTADADFEYLMDEAAPAEAESEVGTAEDGGTNGSAVLFAVKMTSGTAPAPEPEEAAEEPAAAANYTAYPEEAEAVVTEAAEEEFDDAVEEAVVEEAPLPEMPMMMAAPPVTEETVEEAVSDVAADMLEVVIEAEEAVVEEAVVEECCVEEAVVEESAAAEIAAPEYYRFGNTPDPAEGVRRSFEYELKLALSDEAGEPAYTDWLAAHGYIDVSFWSLAEFVSDFGISRERFMELWDAEAAVIAALHPGYDVVTYDLDRLYGMDEDIADSIARGDMGYVTDALYRE